MAKKAAKKTARKATKTATKRTVKKTAKASGGGAKKTGAARKGARKREFIDTGTDRRFVRRDAGGQFKESDDESRSLSADRRTKAKTKAKPGQGDKGDR